MGHPVGRHAAHVDVGFIDSALPKIFLRFLEELSCMCMCSGSNRNFFQVCVMRFYSRCQWLPGAHMLIRRIITKLF